MFGGLFIGIWFTEYLQQMTEYYKKEYNKQNKGVWGIPRLSEAKKDVISCEKLRGGAHIHYIRKYPNGATHYVEDIVSDRRQTC